MSIACKFELARDSNIYYSGEYIEGTITLSPFKQRQVEGILLQFYGRTKVAWLDLDKSAVVAATCEANGGQVMLNDFSSQELWQKTPFSDQQKHVCEQQQLTGQHLLQPHRSYKYKFRFLIPAQTPATSRCPLGDCEYELQVIVQHPKKINKAFHQRIVVKNKLDLSQNITAQEPCSVSSQNDYGQISLCTPCIGFTPGQKVPYHLKWHILQSNHKIIVQLNCFITCYSKSPRNSHRNIKQTINQRKHLPGETMAHLSLPLDCHISRDYGVDEIMKFEYMLESHVIDSNKKVLLTATLPLIIGTTPCRYSQDEENAEVLCYDNYGSFNDETITKRFNLEMDTTVGQPVLDSVWLLPIRRQTHLRRSLKYCYKKLVKII
uniref:Uncharacterized protein n=2 Tax=Stomoxys calcitrans TaxID=35570 RepID=A0A1I8PWF2_STOCA